MTSKPGPDHPFRRLAKRPARAGKAKRHRNHGEWQTTHLLVYEDQEIARLYFWRGAYYTSEQYAHGDPGITRRDLREGETLERLYGREEEE